MFPRVGGIDSMVEPKWLYNVNIYRLKPSLLKVGFLLQCEAKLVI